VLNSVYIPSRKFARIVAVWVGITGPAHTVRMLSFISFWLELLAGRRLSIQF